VFVLGKEAIYHKANVAKWTFLAFQAGAINAIGILAGHRFVSHVTGFATTAGVEFSDFNWGRGIGMLSVPAFFVLGSMISGYLIDLRVHHHRRGGYETVLFMIFVMLAVACMGSLLGYFGVYGEDFDLQDHYVLLVFLSMTCGLQNAMITTASGSIIRTSHLTGISTDLGIGITRLIFGPSKDPETTDRRREIASLWMRLTIIGAFTLGSFAAALLARATGYGAMVLPTLTSLGLWIHTKIHHRRMVQ
jgi:uncharacterized membrane protein YoaK (UPF0700 family)